MSRPPISRAGHRRAADHRVGRVVRSRQGAYRTAAMTSCGRAIPRRTISPENGPRHLALARHPASRNTRVVGHMSADRGGLRAGSPPSPPALDPPHRPASPAVPALLGPGPLRHLQGNGRAMRSRRFPPAPRAHAVSAGQSLPKLSQDFAMTPVEVTCEAIILKKPLDKPACHNKTEIDRVQARPQSA